MSQALSELSVMIDKYAPVRGLSMAAQEGVGPVLEMIEHGKESSDPGDTLRMEDVLTAISLATGQEAAYVDPWASNAPFASVYPGYGAKRPFSKSLAYLMMEAHKTTIKERFTERFDSDKWLTFCDEVNAWIKRHVSDPMGLEYLDDDEWSHVPKDCVAESLCASLSYYLLAVASGAYNVVCLIEPLVRLMPHIIPINETEGKPGVWTSMIVVYPLLP